MAKENKKCFEVNETTEQAYNVTKVTCNVDNPDNPNNSIFPVFSNLILLLINKCIDIEKNDKVKTTLTKIKDTFNGTVRGENLENVIEENIKSINDLKSISDLYAAVPVISKLVKCYKDLLFPPSADGGSKIRAKNKHMQTSLILGKNLYNIG